MTLFSISYFSLLSVLQCAGHLTLLPPLRRLGGRRPGSAGFWKGRGPLFSQTRRKGLVGVATYWLQLPTTLREGCFCGEIVLSRSQMRRKGRHLGVASHYTTFVVASYCYCSLLRLFLFSLPHFQGFLSK